MRCGCCLQFDDLMLKRGIVDRVLRTADPLGDLFDMPGPDNLWRWVSPNARLVFYRHSSGANHQSIRVREEASQDVGRAAQLVQLIKTAYKDQTGRTDNAFTVKSGSRLASALWTNGGPFFERRP